MTSEGNDMFFKKKAKAAEQPQVKIPNDLHTEMYQTFLNALKAALSQPNPAMTPEQLAEKLIPQSVFSDAERAQMLKEALGQ